MKKFNQFISEAEGYRDVNRQVAAAQDKADRAQAKNVTSKGKKLGMLADPYSGKPTKQEVWEYKGKKWLVLGKSVEVFVPMKYHKIVKESLDAYIDDFNYALKGQAKMLRQKGRITLPDGGRLKKGHKVSWLAADKKKVHGVIDFHQGGRYIDSIKVTKSQSRFYKVGDYAVDVNAADIGLTFTEDIANVAGGPLGSNPSTGSIAGYDPMLKKKPLKRSKFAGTECFEVDSDTFQKCHTGHGKYERWDKYLKDDCDTCKNIRAYAKRYPQKDIVIQREGCGTMTYLKRKGVHY